MVRRKGSSLSIEQSTGLFSQKSALNELDFWTLVFESLQPKYNKNTRAVKTTLVFLVRRKGFGVCCGCALHTDGSPTEMRGISVPGSPLFAENSPPGCFLNTKTLAGSNPYNPNIIKIPEQ